MGLSNRSVLLLAALALVVALVLGVFLSGALSEAIVPLGFGDARVLGIQSLFGTHGFDPAAFDFTQDRSPDLAGVSEARLGALEARIPGAFPEPLLRDYYLEQVALARERLALEKYYWLLGSTDDFALSIFCDEAPSAQRGFAAYFAHGREVLSQKREIASRHPDAAARLGIAAEVTEEDQLARDTTFLESISALCAGR